MSNTRRHIRFSALVEENAERCFSVMSLSRKVWTVVGIAAAVVLLVSIILISLSFKGVEYYEYGYMRRISTGSIDRTRIYDSGLYHTGPDYDFKLFRATARFIEFDEITVFAADRLEVEISCNLQYFVRKHQLEHLHRQYDVKYHDIIEKNAEDAIKSAATVFTTREFINERLRIEKALFDAVRLRIGGRCCELGCNHATNFTSTDETSCVAGCLPYDTCTLEDCGAFVEVKYFQLHDLSIPDDLTERYTQALVLQEADDTEHFIQDGQIIRKNIERKVEIIENEARQINEFAGTQSDLIRANAEANATLILENARSAGLRLMYDRLGIEDEQHKLTLDYLRTIKHMAEARLAVNYKTLISGHNLS